MNRLTKRSCIGMAFLAFCALPLSASAQFEVKPGYDLFETAASTELLGVQFIGDPFGTFNFGGTIGTKNTGNTDTIIQRTQDITVSGAGQTGSSVLAVLGLQLETAAPVNFLGNGVDNYFITLQPASASSGALSVTFNNASGGTFSPSLDIFFDVHKGALNGAIVYSNDVKLNSGNSNWSRTPPGGAVTIPGVNTDLNGKDNSTDFWPGSTFSENQGDLNHVKVTDATPEPSQLALFGVAACFGLVRRRRSKK